MLDGHGFTPVIIDHEIDLHPTSQLLRLDALLNEGHSQLQMMAL